MPPQEAQQSLLAIDGGAPGPAIASRRSEFLAVADHRIAEAVVAALGCWATPNANHVWLGSGPTSLARGLVKTDAEDGSLQMGM